MPLDVFVTGAAGFIGSHVAEALLSRGDRVFGLDNFDPFYDRSLKEDNLSVLRPRPGFSFLEGDIRDAECLARWGAGSAGRAHPPRGEGGGPSLGGRPRGIRRRERQRNDKGARMGAGARGPRVLFASSSSVYGGNTKVPSPRRTSWTTR